jgi:ribosomal-protein-alanine N-acetyltransferase
MVNYHQRDLRNRRLEVGYIACPIYRQKGYIREAMQALLRHCFETLDVHRIEALIVPENVRSIRLVEHLGLRFEGGPLRDRLSSGSGEWMSVLIFALLSPEWQKSG